MLLQQAELTAQQRSSGTSSNQKAREPPWSGSSRKVSSQHLCCSVNWHWRGFVTELSLLLFGRGSSAKTSVPIILDGKRLSEDDDDDDNESKQFVVEEMVPLPSGVPQLDVVIVKSFKYYWGVYKVYVEFIWNIYILLQYSDQDINSGEQHGKHSISFIYGFIL